MAENSEKKKLKPDRIKVREQSAKERAKNFDEVAYGYNAEEVFEEAARCLSCKKPKCVEGCPVGVDIPVFISKIQEKDFGGAIKAIKEKNVLPAICGRVCPQEDQCEVKCILGKKADAINIGKLERFVADWERLEGEVEIPKKPKSTGKKVAVVGSGPAGLTVASDLAKLGHQVTIFEGLHQPGGVLIYGIPEFRLPNDVVEAEISFVEKLGASIETNTVIGKKFAVPELLDMGYHAVFIGVGAGLPMFMNIPGENLNGVYSANEYLTRSNLMRAYLFPVYDTPIKKGKNVAVVGGGNVAMDAARTALRLGADNVYLVYRRSEKEMPARIEEVEHAKEEGIQFMLLACPVKIIGEDCWVSKVECVKMELGEPDESGRCRPLPVDGSQFTLDVDVVVMAIGTRANPLISSTTTDLKLNQRGYINIDEDGKTNINGVFAGGDIVTGSATVISAMGAGRNAAKAIHAYLSSRG